MKHNIQKCDQQKHNICVVTIVLMSHIFCETYLKAAVVKTLDREGSKLALYPWLSITSFLGVQWGSGQGAHLQFWRQKVQVYSQHHKDVMVCTFPMTNCQVPIIMVVIKVGHLPHSGQGQVIISNLRQKCGCDIQWMSKRGAHTKNITSHPIDEYHPYT